MTKGPVDVANDADDCLQGDEQLSSCSDQRDGLPSSSIQVSLDLESSSNLEDVVKGRPCKKYLVVSRPVGNGYLSGLRS